MIKYNVASSHDNRASNIRRGWAATTTDPALRSTRRASNRETSPCAISALFLEVHEFISSRPPDSPPLAFFRMCLAADRQPQLSCKDTHWRSSDWIETTGIASHSLPGRLTAMFHLHLHPPNDGQTTFIETISAHLCQAETPLDNLALPPRKPKE